MATTLIQQNERERDPAFVYRVKSAMARDLPNIMAEATNVRGHAKRIATAQLMMAPGGLDRFLPLFCSLIAGEGPIVAVDLPGVPSDAQIRTAFGVVYNTVAGVEASDV